MTYVPEQISNFRATNEEIIKLCGYLKDDRFIASYLDEPVHRIKAVREAMPVRKPSSYTFDSKVDHLGNSQRVAEESISNSTAALLKAMRALYVRVANDRGLTDEWEAAVYMGMQA